VAPLVVAVPIVWAVRFGMRQGPAPAGGIQPVLGFFRSAAANEPASSGSTGPATEEALG